MKHRKVITVLMTVLLSASVLAGCGSKAERSAMSSDMSGTAAAVTEAEDMEKEETPSQEEQTEQPAGVQGSERKDIIFASSGETEDAEASGREDSGAAGAEEKASVGGTASSGDFPADISGNSSASVGEAPSLAGEESGYNSTGDPVFKDGPGVITALDGTQLRVCIFGDDQFDHYRQADGIAALVSKYCNAEVFNCAISGTTAAMDESDNTSDRHWGSVSLCGMTRAAAGELEPGFISVYEDAYRSFLSCDMSKVDVFVLSYGANDFRGSYKLATDYTEDRYTYAGALNYSVRMLRRQYPGAQIIVITPSYAVYFDGDKYLGDTNTYRNSYGSMIEYVAAAIRVAEAYRSDYIDAYRWMGITGDNYWQYLDDGVYFNGQARRRMAQMISRLILRHNGYDVPTETNLDTLDYSTLTRAEGSRNS